VAAKCIFRHLIRGDSCLASPIKQSTATPLGVGFWSLGNYYLYKFMKQIWNMKVRRHQMTTTTSSFAMRFISTTQFRGCKTLLELMSLTSIHVPQRNHDSGWRTSIKIHMVKNYSISYHDGKRWMSTSSMYVLFTDGMMHHAGLLGRQKLRVLWMEEAITSILQTCIHLVVVLVLLVSIGELFLLITENNYWPPHKRSNLIKHLLFHNCLYT
jgi:hypothetical protein